MYNTIKTATSKKTVYEIVKENLIAKIEVQINKPRDEKTVWVKPWSISSALLCNWVSSRPYHGCNVWLLDGHGTEFITFNQIADLQKTKKHENIKLKKGSKGHMVIYFQWLENKEQADNEEEEIVRVPMLKYYKVFSVDDVENLEHKNIEDAKVYEHTSKEERETLLNDALFDYMNRKGVKVNMTDVGRACYYRSSHSIDIPKDRYFEHYSRFLETLAHECAHSTGKALGRAEHQRKADDTYSFEELVAEFTANLLMARFGLSCEVLEEQSAAYIASWYTNIKNCPARLLVNAFSSAERAANFIMGESEDETNEDND